ncbi:MAG: hypothetical protein HUU23_18325 [Caldilineales bacterium]|nr:hypothetical protein [Caldilineales bacterium]
MSAVSIYRPTWRFRAAALFFVIAAIWLGREVWVQPRAPVMILCAGVAIIAASMALTSFARVLYDGETLTYVSPGRGSVRIRRRQIERVEIAGRRTTALLIGYYADDGAGDGEQGRLRFLNLPPLQEQEALHQRLTGATDGGDS